MVYCLSKAKASAAYNQTATSCIVSIIKYGKIPDDIHCEAFLERKRIPGGIRTEFPGLPEGLTEWTLLTPIFPEVKRWRRNRDGCAAQYQGKKAFMGWQTMRARHGLDFEDRQKIARHRKDMQMVMDQKLVEW